MCYIVEDNEPNCAVLLLLKSIYSLDEEQYEKNADMLWQRPYRAIAEFLKPIIIVFNATFGLDETIGFVEYYCDNQFEYPEEYQLNAVEKVIIEMVVKEELTRGEFCGTCQVLIDEESDFINTSTTKRTEFMVKKAHQFISKIDSKDSNLPKEYKLMSERTTDEILIRATKKGYQYI